MRNVYNLGATFIRRDEFDVKVIYTKTGKDITVQPLGERKTFNYLVGLDRLKENGEPVNGGDGKVEAGNSLIFNLTDGFLIFPSLTPFDPTLSYQFKFDSTLKVDIYNSKNRSWELLQHKFEIQTAILDTAVQPY
jgi:cell surface protein SprA